MPRNVLILSASVGAGHVRAGQALEQAFRESGAAQTVHHFDALDYTNSFFRYIYSKPYINMATSMPEALGWLYDFYDDPEKDDRIQVAFDKLNTGPFVKLLKKYQPEFTVCTHFLPAKIISWLIGTGELKTKLAIVVTDFDVHAQWLCRNFDHYFVALPETRALLIELGKPADKITVSGIPIAPTCALPKDRDVFRDKYGLRRDGFVILISAGGGGVGRVDSLVTALLRLRHDVQIVVICGHNEELKSQMDQIAAGLPIHSQVSLKVVGYTKEMDEYMVTADLMVGKPGGLTVSESLARGLVFVIVSPIPGQEERNADHLLEEGVAIRCNNLPVLAYKIDHLLDDPTRLATMQTNARRLARPRAAHEIVTKLLTLDK